MEVETPCLSQYTVTDQHITSFAVPTGAGAEYYLQTSPEYAMKRLLAAGSGSIFQICRAFRADEVGANHNPEFTMLEWYRLNFDHHQLMDEIDQLLQMILHYSPSQRSTYAEIFQQYLDLNVHECSDEMIRESDQN